MNSYQEALDRIASVRNDLNGLGSFNAPDVALGVLLNGDPDWLEKRIRDLTNANEFLRQHEELKHASE